MKHVHRSVVEGVGRRRDLGLGRRLQRAAWLIPLFLLLLISANERVSVAQPYFVFPPLMPGDRPLDSGNSNKIVLGYANSMHTVYVSGGNLYYSKSTDGAVWTAPLFIDSDASQASIAVWGNNRVGIVWVGGDDGGGYGNVWFKWLKNDGSWGMEDVSGWGSEPAIISDGARTHITWAEPYVEHNTNPTLYYTSFPSTAVPSQFTNEIVASSSCWVGAFRKPSLAVIPGADSCAPPKIAIAAFAYGTAASCAQSVGPMVFRRDSTGTFAPLYTNFQTGAGAEAVSLSLSANRNTGQMFLAWSDKVAGVARTMLARGMGASTSPWALPISLSATARHVNLRAFDSSTAPTTKFRLAWTTAGSGSDPFFNQQTYLDTATWDGASPVWTSATVLSAIGAGRPQAVFWQRCISVNSSPMLAETRAFFEALDSDGTSRRMATNYVLSPGCPPTPPVPGNPCDQPGPAPR